MQQQRCLIMIKEMNTGPSILDFQDIVYVYTGIRTTSSYMFH